jgi:predicted ribosome quality control (RQC) complex YloA/Tae2 family protein
VHQETLKDIVDELNQLLPGHFLGKIFQLSTSSVALDFGVRQNGYLFISVDPGAPRLYLINRSARELEKASIPLTQFALTMRAALGGGKLASLTKDPDERIVRFLFSVDDELGDSREWTLVAQLTGRSANLFLLDAAGKISQALRATKGEGQQVAEIYQPPVTQTKASRSADDSAISAKLFSEETPIALENAASPSEAADRHYRQLDADREFDNLAGSLAGQLKKEITKRKKLQQNLRQDLVAHGNPEEHKRLGDLLLANLSSARRTGNKVSLTDYYADGAPMIEVEVDENATLQEAAGKSFSRYTKAKRAVEEINVRLGELERELAALDEKRIKLDEARASRDLAALAQFSDQKPPGKKSATGRQKKKMSPTLPGMRRYLSSDGYEVLVGRTARDNDQLTFRVARPNDLWLHTSDYPGSHVIVRNSSRVEIPHRTILEAAQLAAKFSQASKDSKVAIHYTRRKFLTKPKGAAPGLVRMTNFKTVTVEPGENIERMKRPATDDG